MSPRDEGNEASSRSRLVRVLDARLGATMGARLPLIEQLAPGRGAASLGLAWILLFGIVAALSIWWGTREQGMDAGHARLVSLHIWLALHFGALIAISRVTTRHALDVVRNDIVPFASEEYARIVLAKLEEDWRFARLHIVPIAAALLTVAAAAWALWSEVATSTWRPAAPPIDLVVWLVAFLFTSYSAVRVVIVAAFPRAFASALQQTMQNLYPLCAAKSPLTQGLAALNRTILIYWAMAFPVFSTVMLLLLPPEPYALPPRSMFLFTLVPIVGFLSLGLGAYVYLRSEAVIAAALRRFSLERAQPLQRQIGALIARLSKPDETDLIRIQQLAQLHEQIIAGGHYGSRIGKAISVALPLALPIVGIVDKFFG